LKPDDIGAVNNVREREKAEIALLIFLAEPSPNMKGQAAAAGIYSAGPDGTLNFPRLQLLTIDRLLMCSQWAEHPDYVPNVNFKTATHEKITATNR
jgi:hypothetical protein